MVHNNFIERIDSSINSGTFIVSLYSELPINVNESSSVIAILRKRENRKMVFSSGHCFEGLEMYRNENKLRFVFTDDKNVKNTLQKEHPEIIVLFIENGMGCSIFEYHMINFKNGVFRFDTWSMALKNKEFKKTIDEIFLERIKQDSEKSLILYIDEIPENITNKITVVFKNTKLLNFMFFFTGDNVKEYFNINKDLKVIITDDEYIYNNNKNKYNIILFNENMTYELIEKEILNFK